MRRGDPAHGMWNTDPRRGAPKAADPHLARAIEEFRQRKLDEIETEE